LVKKCQMDFKKTKAMKIRVKMNDESKSKRQERYCGNFIHERPRWSVVISSKGQVESVERLL